MHELEGKSAIITGASRGIGAATAREFAKLGASVVLAARTLGEIQAIASEIWAAGGQATAVACDVSRYDDVLEVVERCQQAYGRVDVLVNNAGVIEPIGPLAESDPELWGAASDINYKGVYHGLRAAIPVMLSKGGGAIVNISSGAAVSTLEGWSQYCSSKAGALSLTRNADFEYRDQGIQIVGLSPGTVATEMQVIIKASGINPVSQLDPSVHLPPETVAKAIAWLSTKDATEFAGTDVSLRDDDMQRRMGLTT
ncbi:MAG: SDR family NAD(P)-dependent oxidoreductase [Alphaproteobacteria bacterium]|nr:SDR family NAD(P)-dependent oxidoreductase [Alphaproteobacteria bacterium]